MSLTSFVLPRGSVDCDVHPPSPKISELVRYMDDYWRDTVVARGIKSLDSNAYPGNAPLTARPDWRSQPGASAPPQDQMLATAGRWGTGRMILNSLYGVQQLFDIRMGAAFATALNDWVAETWLDSNDGFRASIVVPIQNVAASVAEIERRAEDKRFVQILFPSAGEAPYGRPAYWPIYEAAVRHGLPIGIHAGSSYRHPVTSLGWPTYFVEDYVAQSQIFQVQLASLVTEGAFAKFPDLRVVLIESGVAWLPPFLWRLSKLWKGLRTEVPWVTESPATLIRRHVRLTIQPFDAPDDKTVVGKILDQIGDDSILLFASDYPHWQFDEDEVFPASFDAALRQKVAVDNPLATYTRLGPLQ